MLAILKKIISDKIAYLIIDTDDGVVQKVSERLLMKTVRDFDFDVIGVSMGKSIVLKEYELRWRYDFDPTLNSVISINGDFGVTDKEKIDDLKDEFRYLKDLKSFITESGCEYYFKDKPFKKMNAKYIDYVNVGYKTEGGKYDFVQYWQTSENEFVFDYADRGYMLEDGLFTFDDLNLPCKTRVLENGRVCYDYREDDGYNKRHL